MWIPVFENVSCDGRSIFTKLQFHEVRGETQGERTGIPQKEDQAMFTAWPSPTEATYSIQNAMQCMLTRRLPSSCGDLL